MLYRRPTLYICRHGQTTLNRDDAYRGWLDVPLDDVGEMQADEIGNFFSYERIGRVICSDLTRAIVTAQHISPDLDRNPMLRPWNIGKFSGLPKTPENIQALERYINNPDKPCPDGESLADFHRRWEQTLDEIVAEAVNCDAPPVLVTSTSNIVATKLLYDPTDQDFRPEEHDIVTPGGIIALYFNEDGTIAIQPVLGAITQTHQAHVS